eukprot:TRINITY_DN37954_c0_g1_i1.p1 TRINITY_DN37954_c0_g1~~TRINITY_DN37954_c0_g1_i1.p1  ORF type:complete len:236 (+),score=35.96 TRINITY_DN37954_c0_g1_i1:223-930(+)
MQQIRQPAGGPASPRTEALMRLITETQDRNTHNVLEIVSKRTGWKPTKSHEGVQLLTKEFKQQSAIGLLARFRIADCSKEAVLAALLNPEVQLDTTTIHELTRYQTPHRPIAIQWVAMKVPMIDDRDFCLAQQRVDLHDGSIILSCVSVEHPLTPQAASGHVRAKLLVGGWHIKPISDTECGISWVSVCDLCLNVPHMFLSLGAAERNKTALRMVQRVRHFTQIARQEMETSQVR